MFELSGGEVRALRESVQDHECWLLRLEGLDGTTYDPRSPRMNEPAALSEVSSAGV